MQNTDIQVGVQVSILQDLTRTYGPRDFTVRFWDGTTWDADAGQPTLFTLVLNHVGAMRKMFFPPGVLALTQAYLYNDFNIKGDLVAFGRLCDYLDALKPTLSILQQLSLGYRLWKLPKVDRPHVGRQSAQLDGAVHSRQRDRQAISYHYDLSNEYFAYILGPQMVYTSAIFDSPDEDLEVAQTRKLDILCRKLRLQPGERLLDIGCGWGGLVMHAAKHYGVNALGITISERQAEWARAKIQAAGLADRCRVELVDYRDVDERQSFDKIVTVEVIEHFGAKQFPVFFQKCWRLLRPQGSLLIQQITQADHSRMTGALEFNQHYIFPDGELVSMGFTQSVAEKTGFEVRDMEGIREHYCLTLQRWLQNVDAHHDELVRLTDEATYRVFRLHYSGSWRGFLNNVYSLHQTLYVKPDGGASGYPLRRDV
jgi:cyclopropane-fatty-acyl-phospholipid synthase